MRKIWMFMLLPVCDHCSYSQAAPLISSVTSYAPRCWKQWQPPHLGAARGFSARTGRRSWLCGVHSTGSSYRWTAPGLQGDPLEYQPATASSCPFSASSGLNEERRWSSTLSPLVLREQSTKGSGLQLNWSHSQTQALNVQEFELVTCQSVKRKVVKIYPKAWENST